MRSFVAAVAVVMSAGGCALTPRAPTPRVDDAQRVAAAQPVAAAPSQRVDELPSGTLLTVLMDETVSTGHSQVGEHISARFAMDVVPPSGRAVLPAGSRLHGRITALERATQPGGRVLIRLDFDKIDVNGRIYPISVQVESAELRVGDQSVHAQSGPLTSAQAGFSAGAILHGAELDRVRGSAPLADGPGSVIGVLIAGSAEAMLPAGSTVILRMTEPFDVPLQTD
jgi:hypothetical protein